jgi:4-hydroxy-3-methylbut-2-en-1-yl diphosphate synthase IspG/GcpE
VYESKEEYDAEIPAIAEVLSPLVVKCRDLGRAMRIGTNHGKQYQHAASLTRCGLALANGICSQARCTSTVETITLFKTITLCRQAADTSNVYHYWSSSLHTRTQSART